MTVTRENPEYDSILFVGTGAVKTIEVPFWFLESVRRRNPQIVKRNAGIQQVQFLLQPRPKVTWQTAGSLAIGPMIDIGCRYVPEADDHSSDYTLIPCIRVF